MMDLHKLVTTFLGDSDVGSLLAEAKEVASAWSDTLTSTQGRVINPTVVGATDELVLVELKMSISLYRRVVRRFSLEDLRRREVFEEVEHYPLVAMSADFGLFSRERLWRELQRLHIQTLEKDGDINEYFDKMMEDDDTLKAVLATVIEEKVQSLGQKQIEDHSHVDGLPQPIITGGARRFVRTD